MGIPPLPSRREQPEERSGIGGADAVEGPRGVCQAERQHVFPLQWWRQAARRLQGVVLAGSTEHQQIHLIRGTPRDLQLTGQLTHLKLELFGTFVPPWRPILVGRAVPNGFELTFRGEAGEFYVIQRSVTFDDWETIATLPGADSESRYVDSDLLSAKRFYRILIPKPGL